MGLIQRRWQEAEEVRWGDPDWLTRDDGVDVGPPTGAGVRVTTSSAMRLSTVWACVRLMVNTVATLPTDIIVSIGTQRFPEFQKPSWLINPNPADPTMTATEYFAQLTASLLLDGNYFVYCPNSVFDPSVLMLLDPLAVTIKRVNGTPSYEVRDASGQVKLTTDPMHMLHGVWIKMPGALRGLSPIDAARQGIGTGLAAEEFAGRYFGHGSALSFGVEIPGVLDKVQKDQFRQDMRDNYAGTKNSHSIGVLTGGAKFIPGLGVTNEQAQFLETRKFTVEDIAGRIFGIPPHMVGSQEPGASSYNSVEQRSLEFRQYSVLPLIRRIEDPHQRIVAVPASLASTTATAAFRFNLSGIARADLKTRMESNAIAINSAQQTPDEARALEDLPPMPGGDRLYIQSATVPIQSLPTAPVVISPPQLPAGRAA